MLPAYGIACFTLKAWWEVAESSLGKGLPKDYVLFGDDKSVGKAWWAQKNQVHCKMLQDLVADTATWSSSGGGGSRRLMLSPARTPTGRSKYE